MCEAKKHTKRYVLQPPPRGQRGLAPLPYERLRAMVGSGARGMVGTGFSVAPGDDGYPELREEFLRRYELRMTSETRVFAAIEPFRRFGRHRVSMLKRGATSRSARSSSSSASSVAAHASCRPPTLA